MSLFTENLYFLGKTQKNKSMQEQTIQPRSVQKTVDNKTAKSVLISMQLLAEPN